MDAHLNAWISGRPNTVVKLFFLGRRLSAKQQERSVATSEGEEAEERGEDGAAAYARK